MWFAKVGRKGTWLWKKQGKGQWSFILLNFTHFQLNYLEAAYLGFSCVVSWLQKHHGGLSAHCSSVSSGTLLPEHNYSTYRWAYLRNHFLDLNWLWMEPLQPCKLSSSDLGFKKFISLYRVISIICLCTLVSSTGKSEYEIPFRTYWYRKIQLGCSGLS